MSYLKDRHQTTPEGYQLFHDGAIALAEVSAAGVRVDKPYLDQALRDTAVEIAALEEELKADEVYRLWRRRFADRTKLTAPDQLAAVVYGDLGFRAKGLTAGGKRGKADEASLEAIDLPFIKQYFACQKLRKARGTYLTGIQRELVECPDGSGWYVHPFYNLNTAASFRSSCSDPNWQNIPVRLEKLATMIRRAYIPRAGCQLVEIDYGQIEVRLPCPYTNDPTLMDYVKDKSKDMHKDTAAQIFKVGRQLVSKEARHIAKNQFVFPTFYGSYYAQCAPHIWEAVDRRAVKLEDGTSLREHMTRVGLTSLDIFEAHLKVIEEDFWGRRFKVYAAWKRAWYDDYLQSGGFSMLTGFGVTDHLDRKQVCNYPIQGSAFHCLLWSLIRIVKFLRKHKFQTRVVGQIHDCVVADVHPREREDYIYEARRIMTEDIARAWRWLNVPLEVEVEVCPIDDSWLVKKEWVERAAHWEPKDLGKWEKAHGPWTLQNVA